MDGESLQQQIAWRNCIIAEITFQLPESVPHIGSHKCTPNAKVVHVRGEMWVYVHESFVKSTCSQTSIEWLAHETPKSSFLWQLGIPMVVL